MYYFGSVFRVIITYGRRISIEYRWSLKQVLTRKRIRSNRTYTTVMLTVFPDLPPYEQVEQEYADDGSYAIMDDPVICQQDEDVFHFAP